MAACHLSQLPILPVLLAQQCDALVTQVEPRAYNSKLDCSGTTTGEYDDGSMSTKHMILCYNQQRRY